MRKHGAGARHDRRLLTGGLKRLATDRVARWDMRKCGARGCARGPTYDFGSVVAPLLKSSNQYMYQHEQSTACSREGAESSCGHTDDEVGISAADSTRPSSRGERSA